MKRFDSCRLLLSACLLIFSLIFSSCENEEYDLKEKEINTDMTILRDVALPIGSLQKISLDELLKLADNQSVIQSDEDGDLQLIITDPSNVLTQTIYSPEFTFEGSYTVLETESQLGDFYVAYDSLFEDIIGEYFDVTRPRPFPKPIEYEISLEEKNFPKEILEIGYAEVEALVSLNISMKDSNNSGLPLKVVLAAGTEIVAPEWIVIGEVSSAFNVNGNRITLNTDIPCKIGTEDQEYPVAFTIPIIGIDATKLPEGQGITADRHFVVDDKITINGESYLDISELGTVSPTKVSPVVTTYFEFSKIDVKNVEVVLSDDLDIDLVSGLSPITIDNIPDFLKEEGVVLDLADIRLDIDFTNSTPFSGTMTAAIESYTDDKVISVKTMGPIPFSSGEPDVPAHMKWSFSEGILPVPEGYIHYEIPGLTELIDCLPKYIRFKDFGIDIDNEFITILPGEKYEVSESYSILAPLAFGPDFNLPYIYRIDNVGFEFTELSLSSIRLEMDVESTVPLDFTADASLLDADGRPVEGLDIRILDDAFLKSGTLDSPSVSELAFEVSAANGDFAFDGIELHLNASAPENDINSLNVNQSLHVKNVVIRLPEGITLDLNDLTE